MKQQYKANIWQSGSGKWHVNCTDNLAGTAGLWWFPARVLGLSLTDFILLLKNKYNASDFVYNKEANVLHYSWDNYNDAHKWQLYLNKQARDKKIFI